MKSVLSRYLDPDLLSRLAERHIEPRGLVLGNLAGAHKSPLSGFAVEFAGHREYVWGDDPKHVDWRLYYTRDKYFIKQYEMETNFVCHLVLDVSASMRYGGDATAPASAETVSASDPAGAPSEQKLLYAARMASTLGYAIVKQSDKVSLATFDDRVRGFVLPGNSMAQIVRMTGHLDDMRPVDKTRMAECLTELAGRMGRSEIVMIFSDFLTDLDELEKVLQRLRYQRHEVILFQVLHHDEIAFDFQGQVKFVGLEAVEELTTQPSELKEAYLEAFGEFQRKFDDICHRNRVERVVVDTSHDMASVFVDYLNERSVLARR
jgi:uncharacterized protein (DUF58 family)